MKTFSIDLHAASLKMRLVAIGFVADSKSQTHVFQHRHNLFELQYLVQGSCLTKIGGELRRQSEGELYLIAPGVYHSQKECTSPFEKMCIIFEIPAPPTVSEKQHQNTYLALSAIKCFSCRAEGMEAPLAGIKTAVRSLGSTHAKEEIRILTELLLLRLFRRISSAENQEAKSAALVQREYTIDEFFNKNFHRNDGDKLLADMLGVSIRQLSRILKNLYGLNFRQKLKETRLEIAADLLATNASISDISEIMGYSCPANFSTFIKNATGKTPSQLKRNKP